MSGPRQRLADLSADEKRALLADLVAKKGRETLRPLSHGQRALWFLHQLAPESVAYNVLVAWRITAEVDVTALRVAIESLAQRHPALRTTYKVVDGAPVQMVQQRQAVVVETMDASSWETDTVQAALSDAAQGPFDLEHGPVFRAMVLQRAPCSGRARLGVREHVLALVFHHIAYDDWSGQQIALDLPLLYAQARTGAPALLPPPAAEFGDYVQWQSDLLNGPDGERLWAYWKERLGGELPVLNLPTSRPRPAAQTFNGASFAFELGHELAERIQSLARTAKTTPYVVTLAAFNVLLHRLTGQDDILVGTPTAGRSRPEFAGIVGYLVNPVVLRANLSGDPSFLDLVTRVQECVLGAMEHADYPFGLLVERLQPVRDPARSPLFQVAFIWDKVQRGEESAVVADADELVLCPFAGGQQGANFDLDVTIFHDGRSMFGSWKFNADLFDAETVGRFHGVFETLLASISEDPDRRLSEFALLDAAQHRRIVFDWNATAATWPGDRPLHQLIEDQADRTPDATALVFEGTSLTYRALNARANRLARLLEARGVAPEVLVGICMERSIDMVVALLAVLKAGGAYVPLDPGYPADRLNYMLADAGVAVLLTQQRLEPLLSGSRTEKIYLDAALTASAGSDENVTITAWLDQLAYVIYTSGSTGKPKGAMNSHRAIVNRLFWMQNAYGLRADDRVLQKTPFSFDVSVWEFFWPLLAGATLVVAPPDVHKDPAALVELIERERITTLHFVPSMLQSFLDAPDVERCRTLRRVFCSGEALSAELTRTFFSRLKTQLHNLYGPTEAAVDVTYWECATGAGAVPIGRPVANTQTYVLDPRLQPVPVGVEGELYLGGIQVGRGYLRRAGLTAERFIPDPFSHLSGMRLYRTGDRARHRSDGAIEFLGRFDDQVKIRGFRIELGEIEARVRQHPNVAQAAIVVRQDTSGDPRIVAYVVGDGVELGALRRFCAEALPDYMVPSACVVMDALPLSPSGKLDRRALPEPGHQSVASADSIPPRTATERAVAGIWTEVLAVERIGVADDFFLLGGHSLLATKVVSRLRNMFGIELPLRVFFDRPTVEGLALAVLQQQATHTDEQAMARMLAEVEGL